MLAAALVTLLTNWVNTNGENLLFRVVQDALAMQAIDQGVTEPQAILDFTRNGTTAFYGNFFFWVNIIALLLQSLVASRLLKYGGFRSYPADTSCYCDGVLHYHGTAADPGHRENDEDCEKCN